MADGRQKIMVWIQGPYDRKAWLGRDQENRAAIRVVLQRNEIERLEVPVPLSHDMLYREFDEVALIAWALLFSFDPSHCSPATIFFDIRSDGDQEKLRDFQEEEEVTLVLEDADTKERASYGRLRVPQKVGPLLDQALDLYERRPWISDDFRAARSKYLKAQYRGDLYNLLEKTLGQPKP